MYIDMERELPPRIIISQQEQVEYGSPFFSLDDDDDDELMKMSLISNLR